MKKFGRNGFMISILVLSIVVSLLVLDIYGLFFVHPTQITVSETKEALYDTNSYAVCLHLTNNYVYVMEPSVYQSYTHDWSTDFYAKGNYDTLHNEDGYISNTSSADYVNIIMRFILPENWTRIEIYREFVFSTTEKEEITGLHPGNIEVSIGFVFTLYNATNYSIFVEPNHIYGWGASWASAFISHEFHTFSFTQENTTKFGLNSMHETLVFLNLYIYNISGAPLNPEYNFSAWLDFGIGYKIYKNITTTNQYQQSPDMAIYLFINTGALGIIAIVGAINVVTTVNPHKKLAPEQ